MTLPSPETMLTYASILRKKHRTLDNSLQEPGEIALAAAEALEVVANQQIAARTPGHHSFEAVGITTDKPNTGGI